MLSIRYAGPLEAVEIAALGEVVESGGVISIDDDELALNLLEQADWEPVNAAQASRKAHELEKQDDATAVAKDGE